MAGNAYLRATPRRLLVALAAVFALAIAALVLLPRDDQAPPTSPAGPGPEPRGSASPDGPLPGGPPDVTGRFRAASANLYAGLSWTQARADLVRLTRHADVIGLNEVTPARAARIRAWAERRGGWHLYSPPPQPVVWRSSNAVLVSTSTFRIHCADAVWGSRSVSPAYRIDSRWITYIRLQHRGTGAPISFVQTHMDPAVERGGTPVGGAKLTAYHRYERNLLRLVRHLARTDEVLVGGDWNVGAAGDREVQHPMLPFTALEQRNDPRALPGLRSTYSQFGLDVPPTAGLVHYDYLAAWVRRNPRDQVATLAGQRVLTNVHSNHHPIVALVRVRVREPSNRPLVPASAPLACLADGSR